MNWRILPALALAVSLFLGGCAVGPDYRRPVVNTPENFRAAPTPTTNSLADLAWWKLYRDPALQSLIRTALTNNYDLRLATARVEQSRALAAQAQSQFFPTVGYQGAASRGRNEFLGNPSPHGGQTGDAVSATLNVAWEVDVWGRIRRLNESARAEYLATEEAWRGVMLSLVSEVATAWYELLALDLRLAIAQRTTNSFGESLRIFNLRREGGVASKLETARAEAALATTAAVVPDLERQIAHKENQLSVLLGRAPGPVIRATGLLDQVMPPEIPAGLPSRLLERRPDVRRAEQQVRSANAQVGVSVAEFFPQFGLTAFLGKVSPELSAFTGGSANAWSLAASAVGPIFQGGALRAQYRQARAYWEETRLRYEQTVLTSLQEVSNALVTREKLEQARVQQTRAVSAYEVAVTVATQRYVAGKAGYFEVLEAQQELFPAENALAQTQLNQLLVVVELYKALGGGWQTDPLETAPQR